MAGPRYFNYFSINQKESAFNSTNYKRYFPYLEAREIFPLINVKPDKHAKKRELHGNVYMPNSRSRAGSDCQTRQANLVVSALLLGILLSSKYACPL